jgi:GT2 family glycosyltransferase
MRFCLGLVCLNEVPWLRLHLPVMLRAHIDGVVVVDGGSHDGSYEVVREIAASKRCPFYGEVHPWRWDFAEQQNHVVTLAERSGFDAMLKWDPDELLFAEHINQAAEVMETQGAKAVVVSRYNFEENRCRYSPYLYPDKQLRFHVLNEGFYWYRRLHATTNAYDQWTEPAGTDPDVARQIVWLSHINIYHYEGLKPMRDRTLKVLNYRRVAEGYPPLTALPEGHEVLSYRYAVGFRGPQPLDWMECGENAPYETVKRGEWA